jgi:FKBP-type peptidyl-prolyl cis-trans isomerase FkpA/FKBP-type peptidyl-prolyl cis-trans isomerase FklB
MRTRVLRMRCLSWTLSVALIAAVQTAVAAAAPGTPAPVRPAPGSAAHPAPANPDAALHALGVLLSQQLTSFQLSEPEFRAVAAGFADGYHHPAAVKQAQTFVPQLQSLEQARVMVVARREEQAGRTYLNKVAGLPGAHKTATGLVYLPITQGTGASPKAGDEVKVQYTGKLTDGKVFDSSAEHGGPATFTLGRIIPCWTEGLQLMKVGGKARIVCPSTLAYGERGVEDLIKPGATLEFEVQLLDVLHPPAAAGAGAGAGAFTLSPAAPPAHQ